MMEEIDFPSQCVSDYNYIKGRCVTPHYLKPKPKGYRKKFEAPTIITSNPEELANISIEDIPSSYITGPSYTRFMDVAHEPLEGLLDANFNNLVETEPEENFKEEIIDEKQPLHPYKNLIIEGSEFSKPDFEEHEPVRSQKYEKDQTNKRAANSENREDSERRVKATKIDSSEITESMGKTIQKNSELKKKSAEKSPVTVPKDLIASNRIVKAQPYESSTKSQPRNIKSANRGNIESSKTRDTTKELPKRSSSYKERKQKPSPLRTQKIQPKNGLNIGGYGTTKSKISTNNYQEPIQQHANLLKSHNLSLNNFKTEIGLPNAHKFLNETQFIKSPFLSKTLKGMMIAPPSKKVTTQANNYGRIGNIGTSFQTTSGTRKRKQSGQSSKSKRDASNSHKKSTKQQPKMFNSKKFSFNQSGISTAIPLY